MKTTTLAVPDVGVDEGGEHVLATAEAVFIHDESSARVADGVALAIDKEIKKIHEVLDPFVTTAHQAHKDALKHRNRYLDPRDQAKRIVAGKIGGYQQEVQRKHREEQDRLAAIARKHAEEEQLRRAEQLEAEGRKAEAEAVIQAPVVAPVIAIPPPTTSTAVSMREYWHAEVVDEDKLPVHWMVPNQQALDAHARTTKGSVPIPGVVFRSELRPAMKGR